MQTCNIKENPTAALAEIQSGQCLHNKVILFSWKSQWYLFFRETNKETYFYSLRIRILAFHIIH